MEGRALETNFVGLGFEIWKRSVRVRVEVDISYPFVPGFPLEWEQLSDLWIPFKFEKLGNFFFDCGMLGHDQRDCQDKGVQTLIREGVNFGFFGRWLRADNDEFQPGINLETILNPDMVECNKGNRLQISTPPVSKSRLNQGQPNWIQSTMDSWDAMFTREKLGIRDETVEVFEQCEMETLQQIDGTCLEKATADLIKFRVSLIPCSNLITSQPCSDQNSIPFSPMSPSKTSWAGPSSPKPKIIKKPITQAIIKKKKKTHLAH